MIVDLHTHTFLSDGALIPSETVRRAKFAGYSGIALTDHVDHCNYKQVLDAAKVFKNIYNLSDDSFYVLAGGEITHVRPHLIADLVISMKDSGADLVIVHGETITEPVEAGTNQAAILAGVDILAHPGLITEEDAALAAQHGVYLELTTRRGHSHCNGRVVQMARRTGAKLIVNNDAHSPGDFVGEKMALQVLQGAGLSSEESIDVVKKTVEFFERKLGFSLRKN